MYLLGLLCLLTAGVGARLLYIDSYPFGFSGHAIVHCALRRRFYEILFVKPWDDFFWINLRSMIVEDQHGPQSLLESLLTPIFGFGMTESRLIVATIGITSILLATWWGSLAINRWFGLAVGFAVSLAPYHLTYSRNGDSEHINIYLHGFFLLLAAQRVVISGGAFNWLLLGIAAGLGFYVYASTQLLCLIVVGLVVIVSAGRLLKTKWYWLLTYFSAFCLPVLALMYPAILNSWARGRLIPVRVPYGTPMYEFSQPGQLAAKVTLLWDELFTRGSDPWFALAHGCLYTWPSLLAIPGLTYLMYLLWESPKASQSSDHPDVTQARRRSLTFCCALTISMLLLGGLPGVLSPTPFFRRLTIIAMGVDILKGAGLFGIGCLLIRALPRPLAIVAMAAALIPYTLSEWGTFYYKSGISESFSKNAPVAMVREVRARLDRNEEAVVVFGGAPNLMGKPDFSEIVEFDLGYPKQLPAALKLLTFAEVRGQISNAIIAIDAYYRLTRGALQPEPPVKLSNERMVSNRLGEVYVIADITSTASGQPGAS